MQNIRSENVQHATGITPLNGKIKEIVQGIDNPIKNEGLVTGDGGAWRAYNFQLFKPHKQNNSNI